MFSCVRAGVIMKDVFCTLQVNNGAAIVQTQVYAAAMRHRSCGSN